MDEAISIISDQDKTKKSIIRHLGMVMAQFNEKHPFNQDDIQNEIRSDLQMLQDYIINLSACYLMQMDKWNTDLLEIDNEINEQAGLIRRVKSDNGAKVLKEYDINKNQVSNESNPLSVSPETIIENPAQPFQINFTAVLNIGQHPNVAESISKPLIVKIPKDSPAPTFWNNPNDFFISQSSEGSQTSFSEFYHYDPVNVSDLDNYSYPSKYN